MKAIDFDTMGFLVRTYAIAKDEELTLDAQQLKAEILKALEGYHNSADVEALARYQAENAQLRKIAFIMAGKVMPFRLSEESYKEFSRSYVELSALKAGDT